MIIRVKHQLGVLSLRWFLSYRMIVMVGRGSVNTLMIGLRSEHYRLYNNLFC